MRCSCGATESTGCLCDVADTAWYEVVGDGNEDAPYQVNPLLSADPDNLLTETEDGLMATLPTIISNPPAAFAYHSANQNIATATSTVVALNNESYDTDTMHSNTVSNSRLTFTTAGLYIVTLCCAWDKDILGDRQAWIRKNGSDLIGYDSKKSGDGASWIIGHNINVQDEFAANDYVEGLVKQTSGTNLLLLVESYSPPLAATMI